jgi:hypothetical protein
LSGRCRAAGFTAADAAAATLPAAAFPGKGPLASFSGPAAFGSAFGISFGFGSAGGFAAFAAADLSAACFDAAAPGGGEPGTWRKLRL